MTNNGLCNVCEQLVPARREERAGKVFLIKECPKCGENETLISSDAQRYFNKRVVDMETAQRKCDLNCVGCSHKKPNLVFVDITNRCNLNCPICVNNTPSMGFQFEPPLEYFEKIFAHFGKYEHPPAVQLFGGEPTVRSDLFDIITLAREHGLAPRVVTNGLKLANEEYCRRLIESRATILIAYDGANPETYRVLRGNEKILELKQRALDNIKKIGGAKVVLMTCMAKGFNLQELPKILEYVHERKDHVRGIYLLPLAHTWDRKDFDLEPERITLEDLEIVVNEAFPDDRIDFLPAGLHDKLPTIFRVLRTKPLPFRGAHPNCESMYILISDGERYLPLSRYLKGTITDLAKALVALEKRLAPRAHALQERGSAESSFARKLLKARTILGLIGVGRRQFRLGELFKGRGPGKAWNAALAMTKMALGVKTKAVVDRHTRVQGFLQLIVLPFEDKTVLETERVQRCPTAFAYVDPEDHEVKHVPVCSWPLYKTEVMRGISKEYERAGAAQQA
ncbi:MAG: radical SAM protein [Planctomycetes bacterium]|nr:radical SAM protein [Planctomycetota bacterium]